ncbi:MAG: hypothetical protein ABI895_25375 [Deltaproteobacteria bacterium]
MPRSSAQSPLPHPLWQAQSFCRRLRASHTGALHELHGLLSLVGARAAADGLDRSERVAQVVEKYALWLGIVKQSGPDGLRPG